MNRCVHTLIARILLPLAACLAPLLSAQAQTPLKGWVLESSEYPNHQGMVRFFELLKTTSQNRLQGQTLWRENLGAQKDVLPKFKKGEVDFAVFSNVALAEALPEMEVLSLPFLFADQEHMLRVLDGDIGKSLEEKLAAKGMVVLAWYNGGSRSFYARSKFLRYSTEFSGLKMRVANRASMISMVKTLGGEPSTLAYDKVLDALRAGELEAGENDILSYEISEHYKVAPYYTFSHHNVLPEALVVSTQRWAALSDADKTLVKNAALESATHMRTQRAQLEARVRARLEKAGVKFSRLAGSANFVARMKETYAPVVRNQASTDLMIRIMSGG